MQYVISDYSVTVYLDGLPTTISQDQPNFEAVLDGIRKGDEAKVRANLSLGHQLVEKYAGGIELKDGHIYRHGRELNNSTTDHILRMIDLKLPVKAEVNFLDKLLQNPSARAVREFNDFMLAAKLPLTEDGNFRAYKVVRSNFTDKHTGRFDNSVGKTVEVERHEVDDNSANVCSFGLHFCGFEYTKSFASPGDKLIEVEIDPRDVVAFPSDHNKQKGRCAKYVVVRELPMHEDVLTGSGTRDYPTENFDCDYSYDDHPDSDDRDYPEADEKADEFEDGYQLALRDVKSYISDLQDGV